MPMMFFIDKSDKRYTRTVIDRSDDRSTIAQETSLTVSSKPIQKTVIVQNRSWPFWTVPGNELIYMESRTVIDRFLDKSSAAQEPLLTVIALLYIVSHHIISSYHIIIIIYVIIYDIKKTYTYNIYKYIIYITITWL